MFSHDISTDEIVCCYNRALFSNVYMYLFDEKNEQFLVISAVQTVGKK